MLWLPALRGLELPLKGLQPLGGDTAAAVRRNRASLSATSSVPCRTSTAAEASSLDPSRLLSPWPSQGPQIRHSIRVRSVDVLRGWCVVAMVVAHFVDYLTSPTESGTGLAFAASYGLGTWVAPTLLVLAGMGQALSKASALTEDPAPSFWTKSAIRSLQLVGLDLYLVAMEGRLNHSMTWGVLTLHAVVNLVVSASHRLPSGTLFVLAVAVATLAPVLRAAGAVSDVWGGFHENSFASHYIPGLLWEPMNDLQYTPWTWRATAQSILVSGAFPVFPWLCFPLFGMVLGRRVSIQQFGNDLVSLRFLGLTLMCLGLGGAWYSIQQPASSIVTSYLSPLSFFPNSFTMVLLQLGVTLVALAWAFSRYDSKASDRTIEESSLLEAALRRTSRSALGLYYWHFQLMDWSLLLLAWIIGPEASEGECLRSGSAVAMGLGAVVLLEGCLFAWDRTPAV